MMRTAVLVVLLLASLVGWAVSDQMSRAEVTELWEPVPEVVTPGAGYSAPSDAVVLFDGSNFDAWRTAEGEAPQWKLVGDTMEVVGGAGNIYTRAEFEDVQLHIEWATPAEVESESQGRGNSGVFFMDRYEVQVLDSFNNPTYANGQAASVYKQHIPLVNASRPPGEWQSYDIIFTAPRFNSKGRLTSPAYVTVLHNGVLVQNHVALHGPTKFIGKPNYEAHGPGPIRLQDHSNPVRYRNIWIRAL